MDPQELDAQATTPQDITPEAPHTQAAPHQEPLPHQTTSHLAPTPELSQTTSLPPRAHLHPRRRPHWSNTMDRALIDYSSIFTTSEEIAERIGWIFEVPLTSMDVWRRYLVLQGWSERGGRHVRDEGLRGRSLERTD